LTENFHFDSALKESLQAFFLQIISFGRCQEVTQL
jgi:hypothetical protein